MKMSKYIDAERLKQILKPREWGTPDERWIPEHEIGAMLDYFPAADVVEVRHGRWVDVEPAPHNLFYATCSVCGDRQTIEVANYCPMCGASMDGDTE